MSTYLQDYQPSNHYRTTPLESRIERVHEDPARVGPVERMAKEIKRRRAAAEAHKREAWIEELQRRREH